VCNAWCVDFVKVSQQYWGKKPAILEVGSLNVNGSPRVTLSPDDYSRYVGIDLTDGYGVDVVLNVDDLPASGLAPFDVVISTEMLEHAHDWKRSLYVMMEALVEGGVLVLTTRSPGFEYHPYPEDNWRFVAKDFCHIFDAPSVPEPFKLLHVELDPDKRNGVSCGIGIVVSRGVGSLDLLRARLERYEVFNVHTGKVGGLRK